MSAAGAETLAVRFEEHRSHLLGVGYRITGTLADAEDAVQEAWLRLSTLDDPGSVRDLRAWLTTTVARLCLDRLRSAAARRERHVGPWLPEPVVTEASDAHGPLAELVLAEDVRMAAMIVLERLRPAQRVAFVLHTALGLPYDEIADVLGCSTAAARQHATRARRALAADTTPPRAPDAEVTAALGRFAEALAGGDARRVAAALHPDVVLVSDGGGTVRAALREIVGADKVARLFLGLLDRDGSGYLDGRPVRVNGEPGWLVPGHGVVSTSVTSVVLTDGRISAIHAVLDPAKLTRVPA